MFAGGTIGLAGLLLLFGTEVLKDLDRPQTLWGLFLAIPGSVIGFTAYLTLVGRLCADRAAYCTVLFPVVALNVSALFEAYVWTPAALVGLALVAAGNVVVFWRGRLPKLRAA